MRSRLGMASPRKLPSGQDAFHSTSSNGDQDDILTLHTLQELPKARYASKVALTALPGPRGRKVIYSHVDLYKMVESVATTLRETGVRPHTVCGIALPTSVDAIVYFLAVVWIGAIAAPVDITQSVDDIAHVLRASGASTVAARDDDEKVHEAAESLGIIEWSVRRTLNEGVVLDTNGVRAGEGAAWKGGAGDFRVDSGQVALHCVSVCEEVSLVVAHTHENMSAAIRMFAGAYHIKSMTTVANDWTDVDGMIAVLATIYSGGHLIVPAYETEDVGLAEMCKMHSVSWLFGNPRFLRGAAGVDGLSFVRVVGCGSQELVVLEEMLDAPVLEAYGTPETCGVATFNVLSRRRAGTKGQPVEGCSVRIFGETRELVETGVWGLIGVAGDNVAMGYLDNKEANLRYVVEVDEEDKETTTTFYFLTGDKGRLDEDGYLHVVERESSGRAQSFALEVKEYEKREREAAELKEIADERERMEEEEERLRREKEIEEKERLEKERLEKEQAEEEERREKEIADEKERLQKEEEEKLRKEEEIAEEKEREEREAATEKERLEREAKEEQGKNEQAANVVVLRQVEWEARKQSQSSESESTTTPRAVTIASDVVVESRTCSQRGSSAYSESGTWSTTQASPRDVTKTMSTARLDWRRSSHKSQRSNRDTELVDTGVLEEIMSRLAAIEANQREVEAVHRAEMAAMRALVDETQALVSEKSPAPVPVDMDEVNSAISRATNAAHDSQRRTDEAVRAAHAAVEAAKASTAAAAERQTGVVEVMDPSKVHKKVLVSLDEVETAIKLHPAVKHARAFGRPDKKHGMEVFCVICPKTGARVSEPWLKLHAQSVLAAACVPKKFFYKEGLLEEHSRVELADDKELLRVSVLTGFTSSKVIKSPTWMPDAKRQSTS